MAVIEIARIQVRRGQENVTGIPQLESAEFGWAEDTEHLYIGKRIVDGAKDDNNTRILTENDLVNVFSMIAPGSAISSTSSYRYRDDLSDAAFPNIDTIPVNFGTRPYITIGKKLDQTVSLIDFLPVWPPQGNDITEVANAALKDLFANTFTNMQRTLMIPAGTYVVSDYLDLPPQTRLIGEGKDITTLILINDSVNLMRTVDKLGRDYDAMDGNNNQAVNPRDIHIEGMTLAYNTGVTSSMSLISLDNAKDSVVKSVNFKTLGVEYSEEFTLAVDAWVQDPVELQWVRNLPNGDDKNQFIIGDTTFTPDSDLDYYIVGSSDYFQRYAKIQSITDQGNGYSLITTISRSGDGEWDFGVENEQYSIYGFNGAGYGINIRATADPSGDNIQFSENIQITDVSFDYLRACVVANTSGTSRISVSNSILKNSLEGIKLYTDAIGLVNGPTNCQISNNRFDTIYERGIYVGENNNNMPSNIISSNNFFVNVGNDFGQYHANFSDSVSIGTAYPIIEFGSTGNLSTNDYFNRAKEAASAASSYYYNKNVSGPANIQTQNPTQTSVTGGNGSFEVFRFPITDTEQLVEVKYQMYTEYMSRKGTVSVNVRANSTSSQATSVSDTYFYTEEQTAFSEETTEMRAEPGSSYESLIIDEVQANVLLSAIYVQNINGGNSTYYITGSDAYLGYAAFVISIVDLGGGGPFQLITQSANPQFNYDPVTYPDERWTLLSADTPIFSTVVNSEKNYVILTCDTSAASVDRVFNIEYQSNIFQN